MKLAGFILAMFLFMIWVASSAAKQDNKIIQACADKGGLIMHSIHGFVCVKKELLIQVDVNE